MKSLLAYLNPVAHLGNKRYSITFPFVATVFTSVILETVVKIIIGADIFGLIVIVVSIFSVIYFSFRDGVRAGVISTIIIIFYYAYIILTTPGTLNQKIVQWQTTAVLGLIYLLMAVIIGGLKQKIDTLIVQEADERRRLISIVQQLPVGIVITNAEGFMLTYNKKLEEIIGSKVPNDHIAGKHDASIKGIYKNKVVSPSNSPLSHALQSGKPVVNKEFLIERKDGKKIFISVSASPIHNKNGKIVAGVSITSDITAQKELELRKDDFVNMASHELKTPLTSMKLYLDILMSKIKNHNDDNAIKTLNSIKYQTDRLTELVNDLLDVSRLQTGKLIFNKEEFRLDMLVEENVGELSGITRSQKIVIAKKTPIKIYADKYRIYQVITNLITNAIKYSPAHTDIIVKIVKNNEMAVVSIQDSGIGISKEQQKKIFDRLYQVSDPHEKTFPGLGMGLYISKEILSRHNGKIWVESEKGKGSTFYFSLPLDKRSGN